MSLLKLRADDAENAQVISAMLQDALAPVCDMIYRPEEKDFVLVAQRLRRETGARERICCALTIKGVLSVQSQGIDFKQSERILDLLAVMPEQDKVNLIFAGNAKIRLTAQKWQLLAEDFGEPWPALCNPCHDDAQKA